MTTPANTNVGSNSGGSPTPLQRELETTAWAEVNKAALGIVHDSIAKVFSEVNPRYNFGYLGGFGYRATSGQALLDHPLESIRTTQGFTERADESWMPIYNELVGQLPPELLARFMGERGKPFDQRDSAFVATDNLFTTLAKTLTQLQTVSQPAAAGSLEEARTTLNLLLPFAALKGSLATGNEIAQAARDFLADEGANYAHFDGFNNILAQVQGSLKLLQQVNNGLSDTPGGQLNPQTKEAAAKAADLLANLNEHLGRISYGNDLQILFPTLNAMEIIAKALSLPNTATASLFLSLSMATIGLGTNDSVTGLIGSDLALLLEELTAGVLAGVMPDNGLAGSELLTLLVTVSLVVFISMASQTVETGLGVLPRTDAQEMAAARFFGFEAALALLMGSEFIQEIYKGAIAASGGNEEAQQTGSTLLTEVAYLCIAFAGALAGKQPTERLLEALAPSLQNGIATATNLSGNADSPQGVATAVALQQAVIALDSNDYNGFMEAISSLLESLGTSREGVTNDIAFIGKTVVALIKQAATVNDDQPLTGMVNVV